MKLFLKYAEHQPLVSKAGGYLRWIEREVRMGWNRPDLPLGEQVRPNWVVRGHVYATVNSGSWAATCPFCNNPQIVDRNLPFFCTICAMLGNEFRAMEVIFPPDRDVIEAILILRPDPYTWCYDFGETPAQLQAQNIEHGVPAFGGI